MFGSRKQAPSVGDQAESLRNKKVADRCEDVADKMAEAMKDALVNSDIMVGDYSPIINTATKKVSAWFNEKINDRKLADVVNPRQTTEAPAILSEKKPDDQS